jgi:uncharacterized protein (DUF1778 family)
MPVHTNRSEKLDLRLTPGAKQALRKAAEANNTSLSEFVLSSALSRAEEILTDRRILALSDADWAAFHAALDAQTRSTPRLDRLMQDASILDQSGI